MPECLPYFGKRQIRQHILDCLNERRRQIRKGHDYDNKVCVYFIWMLFSSYTYACVCMYAAACQEADT